MKSAFSMVELLVVIGVVAILLTLSLPFYTSFIVRNQAENCFYELKGALIKAQGYAMAGKNDSAWGVHIEPATFTLFSGTSFGNRDASKDEVTTIPNNVSISGDSEVIFLKIVGKPQTQATITVYGGGITREMTIGSDGAIDLREILPTVPPAPIPTNTPIPVSTITPTPTTISTPISTMTPTPTVTSCRNYCIQINPTYYSSGTCRQSQSQCVNHNEEYQTGGNVYCTNQRSPSCCCNPK